MKCYFFLVSLFLLISCGKNSGNGKSNIGKNQSAVVFDLMDLAGKKYIQQTANGASDLYFSEKEGGQITVYLNYSSGFPPLDEYNSNSLKVAFRFDDYTQVEEDVIELSKIHLTSNIFVRNCSYCNRSESYFRTIEELEKYYYDLLQGRETIKVKIIKGLNKNQFYLMNLGKYEF